MKTEEDEAFDDLARRQGMWGGGFPAKRAATAAKLFEDQINYGSSWSKNGERIDPASVYLEEPVQEPFGWYSAQEDEFMSHKIRKEHERLNSYTHINGKFDLALYTTPPKREWVDLSDSQIERVYHDVAKLHRGAAMPWGQIQFGRALQALIKEMNT